MLASMVLGVAYFVHQARGDAAAKARILADERTEIVVGQIKSDIERSFRSVASTRESLVALWLYDRDRQVADMMLKHMLDIDPDRYGAWMVWKPNAFDGRDKDFADKPNSDQTGRFITDWHQDGMQIAVDKVRGYDRSDAALYRVPLDTGHAFLSEPFYIMKSNDRPISVVSYAEPIVIESKILGVVGIDVELSPLREAIAAIPLPKGGNITLVSQGGTVVGSTRKQLLDTSLGETKYGLASAFARAKAAGRRDEIVESGSGPVLRGWRSITFNSITKPWYVLAEIPLNGIASDAPLHEIPVAAIVALLVVSAMMAAILVAVRAMVTRPLANIESFITTLRQEGGSVECPESARMDEIGSIARTLGAFKSSEREVGRLKSAEEARETQFAASRRAELRDLADQLAQSVQSASRIVEDTARTIMDRARTVARAAVASAATTRVIATASSAADNSVGAVDEAAIALKQTIDSIAEEMSHAREIAGEAATQAATSSAVTTELSSRASHIGEIVAMIGSIASRTNLLALNATIEAARAGEAGRGFAVVAQEVKALAAQTTEATGEIAQQIKAMQGTAVEAAQTLTQIGGTVAEINAISASIGRAVTAQGDATTRIGASLDGAFAASKRVNAAVGEVDRATSQTGEAAADMLSEAAKLAEESVRLNDQVLGFIERIRAA